MSGVDTSMYGMIQPINVMGSIDNGMRMRDMIDERKKKSAVKDAYAQGMQVGPDGKTSFDHSKTASALAQGGYGQEAYEAQQQGQTEQQKQIESQVKMAQYGAQVLGAARNQGEWDQGLQQLKNNGIPAEKLPAQFSPENQRFLVESAMSLSDRLNEQWKQKEFGAGRQDKRDARDMELAKLGIVQGHDEKMQGRQFSQQEKMAGINAQNQEREAMLRAVAEKSGDRPMSEKEKELSAAQVKQLGLYNLGAEAEKQYQKSISNPDDYNPTSVGQIIDNDKTGLVPNWMKNDKAKESHAAQANWVEAFLRDASGAAIPPSERMAYATDFFPQSGDTPQVIANKEKLRKQKMENALLGAGQAGRDVMAKNQGQFNDNVSNQGTRNQSGGGFGMDEAVASDNQIFKTNQIDWAD